MEEFQERLIQEQKELQEKIDRLADFTGSTEFYEISSIDKQLLFDQFKIMNQYNTILKIRMMRF